MPQMAPYNWLNLFFMFSFILIYLISFIYYTHNNKIIKKKIKLNKNFFNWIW